MSPPRTRGWCGWVYVHFINFFLKQFYFIQLCTTRVAPCHSYHHEVERIMSILNLVQYPPDLERPPFNEGQVQGDGSRPHTVMGIVD